LKIDLFFIHKWCSWFVSFRFIFTTLLKKLKNVSMLVTQSTKSTI